MANPLVPSFRKVNTIPEEAAHESVRKAISSHDNSITDLNQANLVNSNRLTALEKGTSTASGVATTTTDQVSTENVTNIVGGGPVNDQTGVTAYTTANSDNGALILLGDASAVAVSLNQSVTLPFYCFILNQGAGAVTLTPQLGEIDGDATMVLEDGFGAIIFFDGTDFWSISFPMVPISIVKVAHEWLDSYDSTTGLFTQSQPAYSDLSGLPQLPQTIAAVAHKFFTSYTASTGLFVAAQPSFADISGQMSTAQLPSSGISTTVVTAALTSGGAQGSMVFTNGILTASTPAT